jgi:hypothetical protein
MFMRWLADYRHRPLTAADILNNWLEVADKASAQRDDIQAATMTDLTAFIQASPVLEPIQEENLVAYIAILPRDLRFGFVKTLLKIPAVALAISQDKYDAVVFDAIRTISEEAKC